MSTTKRIMDANRLRVETLRKAFADLQQDMDICRFLLTHDNRDGRFCNTCSRKRSPGRCGSSCALLRPARISAVFRRAPEPWRREARAVLVEYKTIVADMNRYGYNISKPELEQWENWAQEKRHDGMSNLEKMDLEEPAIVKVKFGVVNWTQRHPKQGPISEVSLKDASRPQTEKLEDWVHI